MLIKTPEFVEKFLYDLRSIIFFSKSYNIQLGEELKNVKNEDDLNKLLSEKGKFKSVNFVGSFSTKKYGEILSDIDLMQIVRHFNADNIKRLVDMTMKNSPFKFVRFYCGTKKELRLPWKLDDKGDCLFSLENTYGWLRSVKKYLPETSYKKIADILETSDSLSINDLVKVEDLIKIHLSLSWSKADVQRGFKIENDVRYELLDVLESANSKIVVKFLYVYENEKDKVNTSPEYCLIDCSLNKAGSDILSLYTYYTDDNRLRFKSIKYYLSPEVRDNYREDIKKHLGYLTSLASRLEMILKIKRYNEENKLVSSDQYKNLLLDLMKFAKKHGHTLDKTIANNDEILKNMTDERFDFLYKKYRPLIKPHIEGKLLFYELRGQEAQIRIPKNILEEREKNGSMCPFFTITGNELKKLIQLAYKGKIEAKQLLDCVYKVAHEQKIEPSNVVSYLCDRKFTIYENDDSTYRIQEEDNIVKNKLSLRKAKVYILFGV